jgi:hypothetical protein
LSILIFGVIGPGATLLIGSAVTRSSFNTNVGAPLAQPVPFSHQHHATELGIDCRYCHTSVEKSYRAGIPATETCMSCHSQIWTNSPLLDPVRQSYRDNKPLVWNRLNWVPEFVYFPHNIHVNRGLSCNNCHGPVQKMMITFKGKAFFMVWCLNCHRQPERFVAPRDLVWKLYQDIQAKGYTVDSTGKTGLTPREAALAEGDYYENQGADREEGEKLLDQYHVKKQQLTDCSVCHH